MNRETPMYNQAWCFLNKSVDGRSTWFSIHTISETKEGCWEKVYQQFDIPYTRGIISYRGRSFLGYKDKAFRTMMRKHRGRPVRARLEFEGI